MIYTVDINYISPFLGITVDISWYQMISVGYQFPPLWYHTLNLKSPWMIHLMIQGFNPCIKRKSHRKLVWYFLNHFNHLPTCWYPWFRKYHTHLLVGFPIVYLYLRTYYICLYFKCNNGFCFLFNSKYSIYSKSMIINSNNFLKEPIQRLSWSFDTLI